jgi:hypothetical protein
MVRRRQERRRPSEPPPTTHLSHPPEPNMSVLSQRSIETLLDLVEIKLSCLEVFDREDAREKSYLENSRRELISMMRSKRTPAAWPAAVAS